MKRKLFTLFVAALALVCLVLPMTVGAADDPTVSLVASAEKLKAGDTFTVDVVVANNPGYCSPTIRVGYDGTKIELDKAVKGQIYASGVLDYNPANNPVVLSFNVATLVDNNENGTLVTLTFKVKEDATPGDAAIEIKSTDIYNVDEQTIVFTTENATAGVYGTFDAAVLADAETVYDASEKSITVTGAPATATVAYTYNNETKTGVTDAGTYTVVAKITAPYYEDKELTAKLTVKPAELTLSALDLKTGACTLDGVKGSDIVSLDFSAIKTEKKADKWVASNFVPVGASAGNYTLKTTEFELTVDETTDIVTITVKTLPAGVASDVTLEFVKGSTATFSAPATLPEGATLPTHRFTRWTDDSTDRTRTIYGVGLDASAPTEYTAEYAEIQYVTVTIMQKLGDNDATELRKFQHEKNTPYTTTAEEVVDMDYVFKQWEDESGNQIADTKELTIQPTADITRVAVYEEDTNAAAIAIIAINNNKKKVTVSFDPMGAAKVPAQELKKGELATMPATPKKDGYVFAGWYEESTYKTRFDFTKPVEESLTLTAKWVGVSRALIMTIDSKVASAFGKTVENDVAPIIVKDRTMLPARFVAENLGAKVEWNAEKRQATITGNGVTIVLTIDSTTATVNGKAVTLDSPAFIQNDRTYTPVRFIAEALGAQVEWNETTRQAVIIK